MYACMHEYKRVYVLPNQLYLFMHFVDDNKLCVHMHIKALPPSAENTGAGVLFFCCFSLIDDKVPVWSMGINSGKYPPGCLGELWSNPGSYFEKVIYTF